MPLVATILADAVVVDALSNRVSVFNLFDTWLVTELPAVVAPATVLTVYETEAAPTDFMERVRVLGPGGSQLLISQAHLRSPARVPGTPGPLVHSSIHMLRGIRASEPGEHSVVIEHAPGPNGPWREAVRRTVLVQRVVLPEGQAPAATGSAGPLLPAL